MPGISTSKIAIPFNSGGIDYLHYWTTRTPTLLNVTSQTDTTIDFAWTAGTDEPEGYKLQVSSDGVTYTDKTTVAGNVTTAQATGLTAGVLYYFKVVAYSGTNESDPTNIYDTRFKITVDTTKAGSAADTFVLPNYTSGTYNYYVDWGDGGAEENITTTGNHTHTYAAQGTYQVKIRGVMPRLYFNNAGDKLKITKIDNWGNIKWSSTANTYYGCINLEANYTDAPNVSAVTDFSYMFSNCSKFNGAVNNWSMSAATNISRMFAYCSIFNKPVSNWNTSNVTDMSSMFIGNALFNQSLNTFDTTKVTSIFSMLEGCTAFNQPVSNWNTANVTLMRWLFKDCPYFNQSVANFNTAKVTDIRGLFQNCTAFNQSVASFNTAEVTNMSAMFLGCAAFNQSVANFNTAKVTTMAEMFKNCTIFNQDLSGFNVEAVTTLTSFMQSANALSTINYDALLIAWAAQAGIDSGLTPHFGDATYTPGGAAEAARTTLTGAPNSWVITDGGPSF